jgi:hypothetical protein
MMVTMKNNMAMILKKNQTNRMKKMSNRVQLLTFSTTNQNTIEVKVIRSQSRQNKLQKLVKYLKLPMITH